MPKKIGQIAVFLIIAVITVFNFSLSPAIALTDEQKLLNEAWRIVNRSYIDESFNNQNWWVVREKLIKEPLPDRDATYQAIKKMLATLDDPFTRLLQPDQYHSLHISTSGELTGVGLQIALDDQTQDLIVIAPLAHSPADQGGIQPLDIILEIDRISTKQMSLDEAANRMRGPAGSKVILTIKRQNESVVKDFELIRSRIEINPVTADFRQTPNNLGIGYIRLSQFSANAPTEVAHAINNLEKQGAKAYILDLRNNPGGLLQAGIEIARYWLEPGNIVYTVNRQGLLGSFDASGSPLTKAPLVVLVNQGTASASEILAGALQDNHRAKLVGEKTFGKGLIQSLFDLPDGAGLAVTVAKYETPNHTDINKQGIKPDIIVPSTPLKLGEIGTETDGQYQKAMEILAGNFNS